MWKYDFHVKILKVDSVAYTLIIWLSNIIFLAKPSYDELLNDFIDLHMKYMKLALKNIALKKKI